MSAAVWALLGVITGGLVSGVINFFLQKEGFKHEKELFLMKNQSSEMVKALLSEMLSHKSYTDRTFEALKNPIGGFSDDAVRQLFHEVKAKKIQRDGEEWWYLLSRQEERIANPKKKKAKVT
jgi:hypothetical protein